MTWPDKGDLRFGVYLKPGQELNYLVNSDSSHPLIALKQSATKGVFGQLASLTSLTNKNIGTSSLCWELRVSVNSVTITVIW
jgi:hypothetical protein